MSNYDRGANLEREIRAKLSELGWAAVRSAGSHGIIDVLAVHDGIALFIQAKRDGVISPAARRVLFKFAELHSAVPILADKVQRGKITYRIVRRDGSLVSVIIAHYGKIVPCDGSVFASNTRVQRD